MGNGRELPFGASVLVLASASKYVPCFGLENATAAVRGQRHAGLPPVNS